MAVDVCQEIVGTLVTHMGSGFEGEIDASLDILSSLVDTHPKSMAPFAVFVKVSLQVVLMMMLLSIVTVKVRFGAHWFGAVFSFQCM